ncbi:unnamed protein product [Pseudo-nitzschia multistriata]|uniref:TLDc domain-containing protein n=2 Tax=Pseudo-nitzschia multistriata TaxID=183589 RepID=A0A448ZH24_9STRA|nr:unnamed protein product [Pseudo-nitzschia multistriata]
MARPKRTVGRATAGFIAAVFLSGAGSLRHASAFVGPTHRPVAATPRHMFDFFKKDDPEPSPDPSGASPSEDEEPDDFSDDPVDKIFSVFFGKKEATPMGMKRFGRERFPEQYPAVLDEWAEPVASDDKDMAVLRPMLKNTNLETRGLKLTYSANRDGWDPVSFHRKVDKLGGGLVVCTTEDGLVCGGYNPKGWVGYGEARGSIAAFLYVFTKGTSELPTKLRKVGGPSLAQQDLPETGPSFGADSLVIPLEKSSPRVARSKLGSYYERFPGGGNTLFGKRGSSVRLKDLKVYHGVYAEGEYIPFTDAEPFALY